MDGECRAEWEALCRGFQRPEVLYAVPGSIYLKDLQASCTAHQKRHKGSRESSGGQRRTRPKRAVSNKKAVPVDELEEEAGVAMYYIPLPS